MKEIRDIGPHKPCDSTMKSNNPLRFVILGAGYAGMFLAINLYQSFKEMHKTDRMGQRDSADVEIFSG